MSYRYLLKFCVLPFLPAVRFRDHWLALPYHSSVQFLEGSVRTGGAHAVSLGPRESGWAGDAVAPTAGWGAHDPRRVCVGATSRPDAALGAASTAAASSSPAAPAHAAAISTAASAATSAATAAAAAAGAGNAGRYCRQ